MEKALGLVEVKGLSCAIEAADAMVKAANVTLLGLEAARGSGMMTIKVNGDVGAVRAAVEAGRAMAASYGALVSVDVIARPHEDTGRVFIHPKKAAVAAEEAPAGPKAVPETPSEAPAKAPAKPLRRRTRRTRTTGKAQETTEKITKTPEKPEQGPSGDA